MLLHGLSTIEMLLTYFNVTAHTIIATVWWLPILGCMLRTNHILHHTIGLPNWTQEYRCFQEVTCHQVMLGP